MSFAGYRIESQGIRKSYVVLPRSDREASEMSWQLEDNVAIWNHPNWTTRVDLRTAPILTLSSQSMQKSLTVSMSPRDATCDMSEGDYLPVGDSYVRQGDLIAHFPEKSPFHFGYEAYFCALPSAPDHQILELWLSVQTSKLESNPQLRLRLQTPGKGGKATESQAVPRTDLSPGLYLFQDKTIGIMIHPLDQGDSILERDHDGDWTLVTFGRFMEKGVIRRMRLRIVACNGTIPDSHWLAWMQSFAESPLPLTA
jgi:hypothetical protein